MLKESKSITSLLPASICIPKIYSVTQSTYSNVNDCLY